MDENIKTEIEISKAYLSCEDDIFYMLLANSVFAFGMYVHAKVRKGVSIHNAGRYRSAERNKLWGIVKLMKRYFVFAF